MKHLFAWVALLCLSSSPLLASAEGLESLQTDVVAVETVEDVFAQNEKGAETLVIQTFGEEKGKKYISMMNKLLAKQQSIEVLKKNKERLESKIQALKFADTTFTEKEEMVYALWSFIVLKLNARLYELQTAQVESSTGSVSEEENKKVQKAMDDMQFVTLWWLAQTLGETLTSMTRGAKTMGSIEFSLKANDENIGSLDSSFSISDYESLAANVDSSLKGKLDLVVHALLNGQTDKIDIELSTMLDMVTKKWTDTYVALKNTQVKYSDNPTVDAFVKNIQKISDLWKYIHIGDTQSSGREMQEFQDVLLYLSDMSKRETFSPVIWFTATQKVGNLYYLDQVKTERCEAIKAKYTFIKTMDCEGDENARGIMTLDMSNPERMVYTEDFVEANGKTRLQVTFSQDTLLGASVYYIPNIDTTAQEWYFSYEKDHHLKIVTKDPAVNVEVFATLWKKNTFISLDAHINVPEQLQATVTLKNHTISGTMDVSTSNYDWDTNEVTSKKVFSANIWGKTADDDTLTSLMFSGSGSALALDGDTLTVDVSYMNKKTWGKIQYDNPLFFSGIFDFDYSLSGDFPRQFVVNENMNLEVSRFGKTIIEAHMKATGSSQQDASITIPTPTNTIEVEELYESSLESSMEETIIEP